MLNLQSSPYNMTLEGPRSSPAPEKSAISPYAEGLLWSRNLPHLLGGDGAAAAQQLGGQLLDAGAGPRQHR